MFRRLLALAAVLGAFLVVFSPFASPAKAAVTQIQSPVPTGLARLCVVVNAANAGVCLHL